MRLVYARLDLPLLSGADFENVSLGETKFVRVDFSLSGILTAAFIVGRV
jgi:hypothetical protein